MVVPQQVQYSVGPAILKVQAHLQGLPAGTVQDAHDPVEVECHLSVSHSLAPGGKEY